jgi:hypothetical protein
MQRLGRGLCQIVLVTDGRDLLVSRASGFDEFSRAHRIVFGYEPVHHDPDVEDPDLSGPEF